MTSSRFQGVHFYENDASLCRIVADFLAEGIMKGEPALVIGTPEHNHAILDGLSARHLDIERLQREGDLLTRNAHETLAEFMADGLPDAQRFTGLATEALDRVRRGRDCTVRAYGELVDVLWKDGLAEAAVKVEMLWNQLAMNREFSLMCSYAMGNFYKVAGRDEVCGQHSHVTSLAGKSDPFPGDARELGSGRKSFRSG
jgi:MEDS: MEthanogen/methylotroph, DcmR Sensory domain